MIDVAITRRTHEVVVRGRDGAVQSGRVITTPRRVTVAGLVESDNMHGLRDDIHAHLRRGPLRLYRRQTDERYLECHWLEGETRFEVGMDDTVARLSYTFHARYPFWRSNAETNITDTLSNNETMIVVNQGNVPIMPRLVITGQSGGAQRPKLTNETNGMSLEYLATLSSGQQLELDCGRATAAIGSQSVVGSMDFKFAVGFVLEPGNNTLRLNTESGSAQVRVVFRAAWL